ncbi:hypothetical protein C874_03495 [Elizabethkingia anophelis 502]|nr:hypothetical protein C874_03495 [Elizabethkingia anophelis 502]
MRNQKEAPDEPDLCKKDVSKSKVFRRNTIS